MNVKNPFGSLSSKKSEFLIANGLGGVYQAFLGELSWNFLSATRLYFALPEEEKDLGKLLEDLPLSSNNEKRTWMFILKLFTDMIKTKKTSLKVCSKSCCCILLNENRRMRQFC